MISNCTAQKRAYRTLATFPARKRHRRTRGVPRARTFRWRHRTLAAPVSFARTLVRVYMGPSLLSLFSHSSVVAHWRAGVWRQAGMRIPSTSVRYGSSSSRRRRQTVGSAISRFRISLSLL